MAQCVQQESITKAEDIIFLDMAMWCNPSMMKGWTVKERLDKLEEQVAKAKLLYALHGE